MRLDLGEQDVEDRSAREALEKLSRLFQENPFLNGSFKRFEIEISKPSSLYKFKHNLGFTPTDVILSWVSSGATVSVNYQLTDSAYVVLNAPTACTVRLFVGRAE